jgi:hypothetical protein
LPGLHDTQRTSTPIFNGDAALSLKLEDKLWEESQAGKLEEHIGVLGLEEWPDWSKQARRSRRCLGSDLPSIEHGDIHASFAKLVRHSAPDDATAHNRDIRRVFHSTLQGCATC